MKQGGEERVYTLDCLNMTTRKDEQFIKIMGL